ncbi:hypothetical protein Tco_0615493 [Tanacetum coccineum]
MDPDAPNNTIDNYDIYFQDDVKRYMWGYEDHEQFLAMSDQDAGGSGSRSAPKRTRIYIPHEREEAEQRLIENYFGDDETPHINLEENFRHKYRMSSTLIAKIVNDITNYDDESLLEELYKMHIYFKYVEEYLRMPTLEDIEIICIARRKTWTPGNAREY